MLVDVQIRAKCQIVSPILIKGINVGSITKFRLSLFINLMQYFLFLDSCLCFSGWFIDPLVT